MQILTLTVNGQEVKIKASVVRPGIGVHRLINAAGEVFNVWSVTHLATGGLVVGISFWRFKDARSFARWLPAIDWRSADIESSTPAEIHHRIKELAGHYCQSGRAVGNEYLPSLINDRIIKRYRPRRQDCAMSNTHPENPDCLAVAMDYNTSPDVLAELAHNPDPAVRRAVAEHYRASKATLDELAHDPDPDVWRAAVRNLNTLSRALVE